MQSGMKEKWAVKGTGAQTLRWGWAKFNVGGVPRAKKTKQYFFVTLRYILLLKYLESKNLKGKE